MDDTHIWISIQVCIIMLTTTECLIIGNYTGGFGMKV